MRSSEQDSKKPLEIWMNAVNNLDWTWFHIFYYFHSYHRACVSNENVESNINAMKGILYLGCSLEIAFWSIKICHFIILINGIYRHNHLCFVGLKIFWLWLTRVQNFKCKITMEELYEYNKFTVDWFKWW